MRFCTKALQTLSHKRSSAWAKKVPVKKGLCAHLGVAGFAGKDVALYSGRFAVQVIKNK